MSQIHEIVTGRMKDGKIEYLKLAGTAEYSEDGYFSLKMWALPYQIYYLSRNKDELKYTLFAKKKEDGGFQNPIGFGYVNQDLKDYLQVQFTFPRQRVFLSLFPKNN